MPLSPEARAIAERQAATDRDLLARLIREGRVTRDPEIGRNVPGAAAFRADVERRVSPPVNLAIRPRKRRRR